MYKQNGLCREYEKKREIIEPANFELTDHRSFECCLGFYCRESEVTEKLHGFKLACSEYAIHWELA